MKRDVGEMRHRVTLRQISRTPDDIGGFDRTDSDLATFYASIQTVQAKEVFLNAQLDKRITHRVICRYRSDIQRGMTLRWGSRDFYIDGVIDETQRKEFLKLNCIEGYTP